MGSVVAFADPQLAPGWPVPAGFLAALTVPVGTVKRFAVALDCADGPVGLAAQAASKATLKRRGSDFMIDSVGMGGSAGSADGHPAFQRGGRGAFQGPCAALDADH